MIVAKLGDDAEIVRHEQHRQAEFLGEVAQQVEDLLLRRDIECGRRLVGDDERRRCGERRRNHQSLALAAGKLVRITLERAFRVGQLHPPQQAKDARSVPLFAAAAAVPVIGRMPAHDLQQLGPDLEDRVQRQIRVLRDKADAAAADAAC